MKWVFTNKDYDVEVRSDVSFKSPMQSAFRPATQPGAEQGDQASDDCDSTDRKTLRVILPKGLVGTQIEYHADEPLYAWSTALDGTLKGMGLVSTMVDPCLYIRINPAGEKVYILVHVYDGFMADPAGELDEITAALSKVHDVRDLGKPKKFTGIQLEYREDGSILLHQSDGNTSFLDDCETGGVLTKGRPVPLVPMVDGIDLTAYAGKGVVPLNDKFFRFDVRYIG